MHADPKRNFLVLYELRDEFSLLHASYNGEQEITAQWATDVDSEEAAIRKVLGNRYTLEGDTYDAIALSQEALINMPGFTVGMKKRTVYDFECERTS